MSFLKGKAKTGGRQPGTPNVFTGTFRDAVRIVFTDLGGSAHFLAWARAHPTEFYRIAARLTPGEVHEREHAKTVTLIVDRFGYQRTGANAQPVPSVEIELTRDP